MTKLICPDCELGVWECTCPDDEAKATEKENEEDWAWNAMDEAFGNLFKQYEEVEQELLKILGKKDR